MRPARERRDHLVVEDADMAGAGAAMAAAAAGTVVAAAMVASEEAIKIRKSRSAENWAGLDSNQRRRKASRFTVCPVWPLRYLPIYRNTRRGESAQESSFSIVIRKIQRLRLQRIAARRAKSQDKSAAPASRARRAPSQENRLFCNQDGQSTSAHVIRVDNRSQSRSGVCLDARTRHRALVCG